jgi:hypothetical protein
VAVRAARNLRGHSVDKGVAAIAQHSAEAEAEAEAVVAVEAVVLVAVPAAEAVVGAARDMAVLRLQLDRIR